jgi:hypothetical protein
MRNTHVLLKALIDRAEADGADYTPELRHGTRTVSRPIPLVNARAARNVESQLAIDRELAA